MRPIARLPHLFDSPRKMRQAWREKEWKHLATRRPECYAGLDDTLDRPATLCYYKWLQREADTHQARLDKFNDVKI